MKQTFSQPAEWLDNPINVLLVGVGGNGSEMLDSLARLHLSLLALGHPKGLDVLAVDPDVVSQSNIVRQRFYPSEIGQNKAVTAIQRYNLYFGLDWAGAGLPVKSVLGDSDLGEFDLIIGCVDSVSARNEIASCYLYEDHIPDVLYLDLGNGEHSGQIVLGHLWCSPETVTPLPIVQNLFPEIQDTVNDMDDTPSCSAEESLMRQNFGINKTMATLATNLLWNLFTQPSIDHHGYMLDVKTGQYAPLRIDAKLWSSIK